MSKRNFRYNNTVPQGFKGDFNIEVERLTASLNQNLPFAIFGPAALRSGYDSSISVPNGLTLTVSEGINNAAGVDSAVDFSFTDGTNTDIVRVTSSTLSYPQLLSLLQTDVLQLQQVKMSLTGNGSDTSQFNVNLDLRQDNVFGGQSKNTMQPATYLRSSQFQGNQIDIPLAGTVDRETVVASSIKPTANLIISFAFYFDGYQRAV